MDDGIKLLLLCLVGWAVGFGGWWAFERFIGVPTPDPTDSPGATPFSGNYDSEV